mmetsp:Transcript_3041/g.6539  ORF Transcript_3041/g.6539 Transcript_3041/m.6539 type:complete len:348 (-) Transcript_3041:1340-2383(-)
MVGKRVRRGDRSEPYRNRRERPIPHGHLWYPQHPGAGGARGALCKLQRRYGHFHARAIGLGEGSAACLHCHYESVLWEGKQDRDCQNTGCIGSHAGCHDQFGRGSASQGHHLHQKPEQRGCKRCGVAGNTGIGGSPGKGGHGDVLSGNGGHPVHDECMSGAHEPFDIQGKQAPGLSNTWCHDRSHDSLGTNHRTRILHRSSDQGLLGPVQPSDWLRQQNPHVQLPWICGCHSQCYSNGSRGGPHQGLLDPLEFRGGNEEPSTCRTTRGYPPRPGSRGGRRRDHGSKIQVCSSTHVAGGVSGKCHSSAGVESTVTTHGHSARGRTRSHPVEGPNGLVVCWFPDEHCAE